MKCKNPLIYCCFALLTFAAVMLAAPVSAQSQGMPTQDRDDNVTRRQLAGFDNFLDSHPEVAQALQKDPSLVNNQDFLQAHPELQQYLQQHPEIHEEISQNPNAFMHREEQFDRHEDQDRGHDITRTELANMDKFLDRHPEIVEQLRKDPSLVDNKKFVDSHPDLKQFLADHPGVREEFKEHPNAFMHDEERFDRHEDQGRYGITRVELANTDKFLDRHPEIAEQLRKDPSLVDNKKFVDNHPDLKQFLADHPEVREEFKEHPNAFMRDEERFDHHENSGMGRDRDVTRGELASFNEFLEDHSKIAGELSKNPSLTKNQEYLEDHPELQEYLKANPQVHEELSENPEGFLKSAQQFNAQNTPKVADSKVK
jgi:hypothetical protein